MKPFFPKDFFSFLIFHSVKKDELHFVVIICCFEQSRDFKRDKNNMLKCERFKRRKLAEIFFFSKCEIPIATHFQLKL